MNDEQPAANRGNNLARELEEAYTGAGELTLVQMRQILTGLARLRDTPDGFNVAAVGAVLSESHASHLPLESAYLLLEAVAALTGPDPTAQLSLKRLEDLMSQIH